MTASGVQAIAESVAALWLITIRRPRNPGATAAATERTAA